MPSGLSCVRVVRATLYKRDDDLVIEICNLGYLVHILHKPRQCLIIGRPTDYADILLRSVLEKLALHGRETLKENLSKVRLH